MRCCLCGQPIEPGEQTELVQGDEAHTDCALEDEARLELEDDVEWP